MTAVKLTRKGRIKKSLGWLLFGLLAYVLALVFVAPVEKIYAYAAPQLAPLQLRGFSGTLWRGEAANGRYNNIGMERLGWQFNPMKLLVAKLGYSIQGRVAGARIHGDVTTRSGDNIAISDAVITTTLEQLLKEFNAPPQIGTLTGQVTIKGEHIALQNQQLKTLRGDAVVAGLRHAGLKNVDLGNFKLTADTVDDITTVKAEDLRGVLEMDLAFTLDAERKFVLKGVLKPRADAPRELSGLLLLFGRRQPDGSFVVDRNGALPPAAR